jgi:hypothetical protein
MPATLDVEARESPFHLRGYIGPQHTVAWSVMKWNDDVLSNVLRDLDRDPPEYILVRAPALGGKTTFAMQLMERATSERPDIFVVYLPLGAMTTSWPIFLQQIHQAFVNGVGLLLDSTSALGKSDPLLLV